MSMDETRVYCQALPDCSFWLKKQVTIVSAAGTKEKPIFIGDQRFVQKFDK